MFESPAKMANTRYMVYVRSVSSGVYGPEVSIATATVGSECMIYFVG